MALPPLADLLALLPDNTVGAIQPVNQRDITTSLYNGITDNAALFADYLPLSGGQMIGDLRLPNPPVNLLDACNKQYVDSVAGNAGFVQKGGDTMGGDLIASSDDAPTPRSYTPRIYTEQLINDAFTAVNPLLPDGSVNMDADYTPTNAKGLVTKEYADALTPESNVYRASFEMPSSQTVVEGSGVELVVNSKRIDNAGFSHTNGTASITVLKSGWLKCTGVLGYATTVAGDSCRAVARTVGRVNGVNIAGTGLNGGYIRGIDLDTSALSSSCQIFFEIPVSAGDTVAVFGTLYKKDDNCTTTNFILAGENGPTAGFQISNFSFELTEDGA